MRTLCFVSLLKRSRNWQLPVTSTKWLCKPLLSPGCSPGCGRTYGVDNHHVAEGTEAGEEEDAAVLFEVEVKADELAHKFTKNGVLPSSTASGREGQWGRAGL